MPSLTPDLWADHYKRLRPYVLEEWPDVDEGRLGAIVGDFEALVGLVSRTTGYSEELARQQLLAIDVDEEDVSTGPAGEEPPASLDQLRLAQGFAADERDMVVRHLEKLNRRLRKFSAEATELEVSVNQRGETNQEVVLEAWLPKFPHMVATSGEPELKTALREARDRMWRQIDDAVNRRKELR